MTDDVSEKELERRMRAALFGVKSTKVEVRRSGARKKIDPSEFKGGVPPASRPARKVPVYVVNKYSPEYDAPFWRIYRVGKAGLLKIYRNCESDAELEEVVSELETAGAEVRRMGQ